LLTLPELQVLVRGCLLGKRRGNCSFSKVKWRSPAGEGDAAASCIGCGPSGAATILPQRGFPLQEKNPEGRVGFSLEGEFWANSASSAAEPETRAQAIPVAGSTCHLDPRALPLHLEMVRPVPLNENNLCYGTSKIIIN